MPTKHRVSNRPGVSNRRSTAKGTEAERFAEDEAFELRMMVEILRRDAEEYRWQQERDATAGIYGPQQPGFPGRIRQDRIESHLMSYNPAATGADEEMREFIRQMFEGR